MTKRFLTYHARADDPKTTQSADLKFEDGVEFEVPPGREWLWWRLQTNPWFTSRVEEDEQPPAEVLPSPTAILDRNKLN